MKYKKDYGFIYVVEIIHVIHVIRMQQRPIQSSLEYIYANFLFKFVLLLLNIKVNRAFPVALISI